MSYKLLEKKSCLIIYCKTVLRIIVLNMHWIDVQLLVLLG